MSNLQDIPDPHQDWRGERQPKPRSLLKQVYKWCFKNLLLEPVCQFSFYALRVIDRTTGMPYSADELQTKILAAFAGSVATDDLVTEASNGNAAAGKLGEYVADNFGPYDALSSGVALSVGEIELTAGDWDVSGVVSFDLSGASGTIRSGGISPNPSFIEVEYSSTYAGTFSALTAVEILPLPIRRISLTETTTIHVIAEAAFSGGTMTAAGQIRARRVR